MGKGFQMPLCIINLLKSLRNCAMKPLDLIDAYWTVESPDHLMPPWSEEQVNHVCSYFVAKFLEMEQQVKE